MERIDVLFSAETNGGSWVVLVQNGCKAKATYFKGDDAQRLAYEYAAGVLGKKDEPCRWWSHERWVGGPNEGCKPDPFLAAYAKARELLQQSWSGTSYPLPSPWISVKERGPAKRPNGPNTFVLAAKVGPDGCEYIRMGETDGTYWHNVSNGTRLEGVTHWMPLPEPPKE